MDAKQELDELLKKHIEFCNDKMPEPNPAVLNELRAKVAMRKQAKTGFQFTNRLINLLNTDIKLYKAGIGIVAVTVLFTLLRPSGTPSQNNPSNNNLVADTNSTLKSNSYRQDSFLVKNFSFFIN